MRIVFLAPLLALVFLQNVGCTSTPVRDMSNMGTAMVDCGYAPNCVSSLATDPGRRIEPIRFKGVTHDYQRVMKAIFNEWGDAEIVRVERNYMHVVCASNYLKFKDDLEMYFIPEKSLIHVRSASRVAYYDFDGNRRRIEELRDLIMNRGQKTSSDVQSGDIELSPNR